jgi:hypothetical protein
MIHFTITGLNERKDSIHERTSVAGVRLAGALLVCLLITNCLPLIAQEIERYPDGVEGIKAGTLPPPGFYWASYNVWYRATTLKDGSGNALPAGFDLRVLATAQRFVWITDATIFGANYGMDVIIPLVNTRLAVGAAGLYNDETGFGDIGVGQELRWTPAPCDVGFGIALFIPTGRWDITKPALPGRDYYTLMLTLGTTYYLDKERLWAATVLSRYEFQGGKRHIDLIPGDDFHFEWGISNSVAPILDVGLVGYCQWQVTADRGSAAVRPAVLDRVFAVGPEVDYFLAPAKLVFKVRYETELGAVDRPQGGLGLLTLIKIF